MGNYHYQKANYFDAFKKYSDAVQLWTELEKTSPESEKALCVKRKGKAYDMIGTVYSGLGNFSEALNYFQKALTINEQLGDSIQMAQSIGNLGRNAANLKDFDKAIEYLERSIAISESKGDLYSTGVTLGNLGNAYLEKGDFLLALNNSFRSLEINKLMQNERGESYDYNGIGNAYQELGKFDSALYFYNLSFESSNRIGDMYLTCINHLNLGKLYTDINSTKASFHLTNALALAKSQRFLEIEKLTHNALSTYFESLGNLKSAINHCRLERSVGDSIFNSDESSRIATLLMQFDFDRKENLAKVEQEKRETAHKVEVQEQKLITYSTVGVGGVIILASIFSFMFYKRKRDAEHKQKETLLSLQVSETEMKALRSQMNPHFIFNALQSIQTFLINHKSEEANLYLLKFSKLMRAVLENSLHSEISIKDDIQALELYMQLESIRLPFPFTYSFHIDESVDIENDSIPPLILQPFVENSIWHGLQYKNEPGHINIYISKKGGALHTSVEDNGVGRDMSRQVAQPMLLKKESLGMKLTEERLNLMNEVKKSNAHFSITDLFNNENQPAGTKVQLLLPLVA